MSAAHIQAQAEQLDAQQVIADARQDAASGDRTASLLLRVVRVVGDTERASLALLEEACASLLHQRRHDPEWQRDQPWPRPRAELRGWLLGNIGQDLRFGSSLACASRRFHALKAGAKWLADAARLARRDGHVMRQPGGLRLAASAFDDQMLRAEIVPADADTGERGDVLRLTWEDTGRLVVQSLPGRFADVDTSADPE